MPFIIDKIRIQNFKRFRDFTLDANDHVNIIVGDNESGKSTVLEAISLVINASEYQIESRGLDVLFNKEVINEFLNSQKGFDDLPKLIIELYLKKLPSEEKDPPKNSNFEGRNNLDMEIKYGIKLVCEINSEYEKEVKKLLKSGKHFPYDYYTIRFETFSGSRLDRYSKPLGFTKIDSSIMNTEYATSDFSKRMFSDLTSDDNLIKLKAQEKYRAFRYQANDDLKKTFK